MVLEYLIAKDLQERNITAVYLLTRWTPFDIEAVGRQR